MYGIYDSKTHHETHDFVENIRRSHGSVLSVSVISRSYLDNITGDKVNTLKSADYCAELSG